jgi:MFS family permease
VSRHLIGRRLGLLGREPGFRSLFLATLGSGLGTWLALVALQIDVLRRTHSPLWMSALLIADILPTLLVGIFAGPLVDRLSRRGLMIGADLVRFGVFCALPFAPNATTIVGLAAVIGIATGFFRPAVYAGLPNLVADEDLPRANSLLQMIDNSTWAIGSLVGGALVAAQGPNLAYWINAATFLVSAALLAQIPRRLLQEARAETRGHWRDLADGLVLVHRSRALLTVLIAWNVGMVANAFVNVGEPFLATDSFSAGSFGLGLMMGSAGIGLAAGAYLAGSWIDARGLANIYGVSLGLMALGVAGAGPAPRESVHGPDELERHVSRARHGACRPADRGVRPALGLGRRRDPLDRCRGGRLHARARCGGSATAGRRAASYTNTRAGARHRGARRRAPTGGLAW